MKNALELSDGEFMSWAGLDPRRWALLSGERREAWLDHLVARIRTAADVEDRDACWRLAYVVASAETCPADEFLYGD